MNPLPARRRVQPGSLGDTVLSRGTSESYPSVVRYLRYLSRVRAPKISHLADSWTPALDRVLSHHRREPRRARAMSIFNDYSHQILHHQAEQEIIWQAEQNRLARE